MDFFEVVVLEWLVEELEGCLDVVVVECLVAEVEECFEVDGDEL